MIVKNPFLLKQRYSETGNVLFIILLAIVLIGALTAAIQSSNRSEGSNIDAETLVIRASEVQRYASELERAVTFIMQNGASESDLRFAHPDAHSDYGDLSADADPSDQVFHVSGGGASYRAAPGGINDGSAWEFYAGTHIPGMGTASRAELIAVLPNVTQAFCNKINEINDQPLSLPNPPGPPEDTGASAASGSDPGACLNIGALGRFNDTRQFYTTINTVDETTFTQDPNTGAAVPAPQACVKCAIGPTYHFYHVLLAR
ncbi:MAG TPA: hypothetical protein PK513_03295 [Alphaproteobacteria bacterium]|nr:hypothetical protein [Alphaproteobacteria bacterium]USO05106.1 MAG: hypothetical protein H6859_08080 [Rhodospirillales bacterium]HOO81509.1 hypothetical protein [Alphaproteobacteria bacterium]